VHARDSRRRSHAETTLRKLLRENENLEGRGRVANNETARLAVLIDADNASASVVKELLEEVAKYGTATVKRAYGD